jgi:hypothetical protein
MTMTSRFVFAFAVAIGSFAAHAQVAPVKPGLWDVHIDRTVDGQKEPDLSERLKNVPPERRQQVEAMMKERGIGNAGNGLKVCQTKEMLDAKRFVNPIPDCKTTFGLRTNTAWKSHTSCPQMHFESDTEIKFVNAESYSVKSSSVSEAGGKSRKTETLATGKWLSADCGDIKPMAIPGGTPPVRPGP